MSSDDSLTPTDVSLANDSYSAEYLRAYDSALRSLEEFCHLDIQEAELDFTSSELLRALLRLPAETTVQIFTHGSFTNTMMVEFVLELERQGCLLPLMQELLSVQLHAAADPATLFREDHVSTRLIQVYLFTRRNRKFLALTVAPLVERVARMRRPIEADDVEEALAEAAAAVEELVGQLLAALAEHIGRLPLAFGYLVADTKQRVASSFPDYENDRSIECVFFFLRFICPALVSPHKYNVPVSCTEEALTAPVLKGLVYISKLLQAVGSGVEFDGSKEAHMVRFNHVVQRHKAAVHGLYEQLLSKSMRADRRLAQNRSKKLGQKKDRLASAGFLRTRLKELGLVSTLHELGARPSPVQEQVHPALWSVEEVGIWLRSAGLEEFVATFRKEAVDGRSLLSLTPERFSRQLGIAVPSQRLQVQRQLAALLEDSLDKVQAKASLSSSSATAMWLKRSPLKSVARVVRKLELPPEELLALTADDLLLCGLPRAKVEDSLAVLRGQRFWHGMPAETRQLALLGKDAVHCSVAPEDARLDMWFTSLSGSLERAEDLERAAAPSGQRVRSAFESGDAYVTGILRMKSMRKWKEFFLVLARGARQLAVYPVKAAPLQHDEAVLGQLGSPLKLLNVVNCTIQDGSGFTGKEGTISIYEKGKHVRYIRCPSQRVAELWLKELLKYTLIMAVDKLNLEMFDAPAVAATDQGVAVGANKAALLLFGYSEEEVVGKNVRQLMPPEVGKFHNSYLSNYRKYRDRRLIGKKRVVRIRRKDGSEPHCIIRLGEYYEGKKLRFVATFNYDDALVQQELDLLRSNLEAMLDTTDDEDLDDNNWSEDEDEDDSDTASATSSSCTVSSADEADASPMRSSSDRGATLPSLQRSHAHRRSLKLELGANLRSPVLGGSLSAAPRRARSNKVRGKPKEPPLLAVRRSKSDLESDEEEEKPVREQQRKKKSSLFSRSRRHVFSSPSSKPPKKVPVRRAHTSSEVPSPRMSPRSTSQPSLTHAHTAT